MGDVNRAIMSPDRQGKQYLCIDSSARKVTLGVRSDESSLWLLRSILVLNQSHSGVLMFFVLFKCLVSSRIKSIISL